jgi:hypothetical protein
MFESLANILKTLTPAQRLLALAILLLSIVAITLGPGYINRNNCDELYPIIKQQKTEIASLSKEILDVQKECTQNSLQREKEIREIVLQMEAEIDKMGKFHTARIYRKETIQDTVQNGGDTIMRVESSQVRVISPDLSGMRKSLKCLKDKLGTK